MSRWNPHEKQKLSALGRIMAKYLPHVLALTLAFALSLQLVVVATDRKSVV